MLKIKIFRSEYDDFEENYEKALKEIENNKPKDLNQINHYKTIIKTVKHKKYGFNYIHYYYQLHIQHI